MTRLPTYVVWPALFTLALFGIWEIACTSFSIPPSFLPAPSTIAQAGWNFRKTLIDNSAVTLWTTLVGFGIATVGCLLSEIKLSNAGLGHAAMQAYSRFDIPTMLALLLVIFALAGLGNYLIGRLVRLPGPTNRRVTRLQQG